MRVCIRFYYCFIRFYYCLQKYILFIYHSGAAEVQTEEVPPAETLASTATAQLKRSTRPKKPNKKFE